MVYPAPGRRGADCHKEIYPTMSKLNPPFHADQVGSLLRPDTVLEARARYGRDEITAAELRAIEDEAIAAMVKKVESIGMKAVTDGEFRREYFHLDFLKQLEGMTVTGSIAASSDAQEKVGFTPPKLSVTGKLRHVRDIQVGDFEFLKSCVTQTPKVSIPSPTMAHFRGGRAAIDIEAYPDLEEFFADLAQCYRDEIRALYNAGCRYIQMDDTNLAYLCDDEQRAGTKGPGTGLAVRSGLPLRVVQRVADDQRPALDQRPQDRGSPRPERGVVEDLPELGVDHLAGGERRVQVEITDDVPQVGLRQLGDRQDEVAHVVLQLHGVGGLVVDDGVDRHHHVVFCDDFLWGHVDDLLPHVHLGQPLHERHDPSQTGVDGALVAAEEMHFPVCSWKVLQVERGRFRVLAAQTQIAVLGLQGGPDHEALGDEVGEIDMGNAA